MDLFVVLGLRHGASEGDIKRAYRRLARRYHPDINPGDRESADRFRLILEAYETLTDPDRRSRYEAGVPAPETPQVQSTGFEGFDFSNRAVDYSATFGDLFAEVLSERAARPRDNGRGVDLHHQVELSFAEALAGTVRVLTVTRQDSCVSCAGVGAQRATGGSCRVCGGSGTVKAARGHMIFSHGCRACGGGGLAPARPCGTCRGTGTETRAEAISIRLPAGVADKARVRIPRKGHVGRAGGAPGDLYVTVAVQPDERFRRDGDDLHTTLAIAVHEAALGARVDLSAPDGPARITVPPGTQSGQRLRLRERGAVSIRTGQRGDLVVEVRVVLPAVLDERSQELMREFGRLNAGTVRER
jgi:molecular chaperone DnaJ